MKDETIGTLRFANRAKLIKNVVKKNMVLSPAQMRALIQQLKIEVQNLRKKLQEKVIKEVDESNVKTLEIQTTNTIEKSRKSLLFLKYFIFEL